MDIDEIVPNARSYEERLIHVINDLDTKILRLRKKKGARRKQSKRARRDNELERLERSVQQKSFLELCLDLHRNDPSKREIDSRDFPQDYAQHLGEALRGNTHVSSMSIVLRSSCRSRDDPQVKYVAALARYIENSTSLRSVKIIAGHRDIIGIYSGGDERQRAIYEAFLRAIGRSAVEEFAPHGMVRIPPAAFCDMLTTTVSLRTLHLNSLNRTGYTQAEVEKMATAMAFNQTITCLISAYNCPLLFTALKHVTGFSRLLELHVEGSTCDTDEKYVTLCTFLCASVSLRHLQLNAFIFQPFGMQALVHCMRQVEGTIAPSASFTKLTLENCTINDAPMRILTEFMQCSNHDGMRSSLRELCLLDTMPFAEMFRGEQLATMLSPIVKDGANGDNWYPTIGSQLLSVSMPFRHCDFMRTTKDFVDHAHDIHIQCLRLDCNDVVDENVLMALLGCFPCLKDLHLLELRDHNGMVFRILRKFTNIHSITIDETTQDALGRPLPILYTETRMRLVQAYAQRNQNLDPLLRAMSEPDRRGLLLYPAVVQGALQASDICVRSAVSSLTRLGDVVGPDLA